MKNSINIVNQILELKQQNKEYLRNVKIKIKKIKQKLKK